MTAEIAILNRNGIALAADSAVTSRIGRYQEAKIYTSADKLFQLAARAPVGAMIYNSANFIGLPWETIIKAYRRRLGPRTFDRLGNYAQDFFQFLTRNPELFPQEAEEAFHRDLILSRLRELRAAIQQSVENQPATGPAPDPNQVARQLLDQLHNQLILSPPFEGCPDVASSGNELLDQVITLATEFFAGAGFEETTIRAIAEWVRESLCRADIRGPYTGLVLAGYGEKEYLPKFYEFRLEGLLFGHPRRVMRSEETVDFRSPACIQPFAQDDQVIQFMQGIDSQLEALMVSSSASAVRTAVDAVAQAVREASPEVATLIEARAQEIATDSANRLHGLWRQAQQSIWRPIIEMVALLPKDEIAAAAEALVSLTKFRRRITPTPETVGGPIDVAVITKGDGFVWVKRKHYFDPGLNPRAVARLAGEYQ